MQSEKEQNLGQQRQTPEDTKGGVSREPRGEKDTEIHENTRNDNEEWIEEALAANRVAEYVSDKGNENENKEQYRTTAKKKLFLEIFGKTMGTITVACEKADIARETYYLWKNTDPDFVKRLNEVEMQRQEMVEDRVYKLIQQDDGPTIRWFLERTTDKYKSKQVMEHHADERTFTNVVDKLLDKINKKDHGTDA